MNTKVREISNMDDIIDVRDIIARVEHLEPIRQPGPVDLGSEDNEQAQDDLFAELTALEGLLHEIEGKGGDEKWKGVWYPVTLIQDSYFVEYTEEMLKDCGELPDIPSYIIIDWEATADNVRQDYSSVEFDGVTYWYR